MRGVETKSWREFWESLALSSDPRAAIDGWDAPRARYRRVTHELAALVNPAPGERVLNVGCGLAHFEAFVGRRAKGWVAMDLAWNMVLRAKQNNKGNARLHVIQGSALQVPFADGIFDKALANGVLQYLSLDEVGMTMREMARVTKPNAFLFIGDIPERPVAHSLKSGIRAVYRREGLPGLLVRLLLRFSWPARMLLRRAKWEYLKVTCGVRLVEKPAPISMFAREELIDLGQRLGLEVQVVERRHAAYYRGRFSLVLRKRSAMQSPVCDQRAAP